MMTFNPSMVSGFRGLKPRLGAKCVLKDATAAEPALQGGDR